MSITFKKVVRKNPFKKDDAGKFYPQLIVWGKSATLESISVQMNAGIQPPVYTELS